MNVLVGLWWPQNPKQMRSSLSSHTHRYEHPVLEDRNPITEWGTERTRQGDPNTQVLVSRSPGFLTLDLRTTASFLKPSSLICKVGVTYHPSCPLSEDLVRMKSRKVYVSRRVPQTGVAEDKQTGFGGKLVQCCHLQMK